MAPATLTKFCCILGVFSLHQVIGKHMNVLFLVSDDMRPNIEAFYGPDFPSQVYPPMHTPGLDALASRSLVLKRAYVQQAVCSPSRTSLLTSRRPDTTHVYDLVKYFREVGGNYTTIPQYFKENGYLSIGMGKIFHPGQASGHDDPISWSEPYFHAPNLNYWDGGNASWMAVSKERRQERELPDIQTAEHAVEVLRRVAPKGKTGEQPFFVAVGFHRPHLPFVFPEEFLDLYPHEEIRLPENMYAPVGMPPIAWVNYITHELGGYNDIAKLHPSGDINTTLPFDLIRDLRRGYYCALSFTDSLIDTLLYELHSLGLEENTIVSFWGDHGWHLGENGEWAKQTNFEKATHAPMMVKVPGITDQGITTEALTEFVDLFPTLVEVAGLPQLPKCPVDSTKVGLCTEGNSLVPLMRNPRDPTWKDRVFSQFPREANTTSVMGYTMRTNRYRYTEWVKFSYAPDYKPDWSASFGTELYDQWQDPDENRNRAEDPMFQDICKELSAQLHAGWREAF